MSDASGCWWLISHITDVQRVWWINVWGTGKWLVCCSLLILWNLVYIIIKWFQIIIIWGTWVGGAWTGGRASFLGLPPCFSLQWFFEFLHWFLPLLRDPIWIGPWRQMNLTSLHPYILPPFTKPHGQTVTILLFFNVVVVWAFLAKYLPSGNQTWLEKSWTERRFFEENHL